MKTNLLEDDQLSVDIFDKTSVGQNHDRT